MSDSSPSDAYQFLPPVPVYDKDKRKIGEYQIVRGAGHPEDPLYMMNVSVEDSLIANVTVYRSYSMFSLTSQGSEHYIEFKTSIPQDYLTEAAPVIIACKDEPLEVAATKLGSALNTIQAEHMVRQDQARNN